MNGQKENGHGGGVGREKRPEKKEKNPGGGRILLTDKRRGKEVLGDQE